MIILGIDPGYAIVGYGAIEKLPNGKCRMLKCGAITTPKEMPFPERLSTIASDLKELLHIYNPDCVAIEELFFNSNTTTAIAVAEARGVILCTCVQENVPLFEYTPLQIKQAITGTGRAEKHQVQYMTQMMLGLKSVPKPDDAADALAVALCRSQTNERLQPSKIK